MKYIRLLLMLTEIRPSNPFGVHLHSFLWEILGDYPKGRHLDYGAYDGSMLAKLAASGRIAEGIGLEVNLEVIRANQERKPRNIQLVHIIKGSAMPLPSASCDSASIYGVLEHVVDQSAILAEMHRVLKAGSPLVVAVPGRHLFSFLDLGNLKFRFPALHRHFYTKKHGAKVYHERYVECKNGLFGDIEKEKMWHQHFSPKELTGLLERNGFKVVKSDGMGFFGRVLMILELAVPGFLKGPLRSVRRKDMKSFRSTELLFLCEKVTSFQT